MSKPQIAILGTAQLVLLYALGMQWLGGGIRGDWTLVLTSAVIFNIGIGWQGLVSTVQAPDR